MNETLTPEMNALIAALGRLVKTDPRCEALENAIAEYEDYRHQNEREIQVNRHTPHAGDFKLSFSKKHP